MSESTLSDLRSLCDFIASRNAGCLGYASRGVTLPDGEAGLENWPIRDEVVDTLAKAIATEDALRTKLAALQEAVRAADEERRVLLGGVSVTRDLLDGEYFDDSMGLNAARRSYDAARAAVDAVGGMEP